MPAVSEFTASASATADNANYPTRKTHDEAAQNSKESLMTESRFTLAEALRSGLLDMVTAEPVRAWSGSFAELIDALAGHRPADDAAWLRALDATSLLDLAREADL